MKRRIHKKQVNRYTKAYLIRYKQQKGSHKRWISQAKFDRFCESAPNGEIGSAQHINMLAFQKAYNVNVITNE